MITTSKDDWFIKSKEVPVFHLVDEMNTIIHGCEYQVHCCGFKFLFVSQHSSTK